MYKNEDALQYAFLKYFFEQKKEANKELEIFTKEEIIEEVLVTFKVAKLAHENNFNQKSKYFDFSFFMNENGEEETNKVDAIKILRPSQTILRDWLMSKFNIIINIKHKPFNQKYGYSITGKYQDGDNGVLQSNEWIFDIYDFKTFENTYDCLEDALEEALKLIVKI